VPDVLAHLSGYSPRLIAAHHLALEELCDYVQITPHGQTGPVHFRLITLGPISADSGACVGEAERIVSRLCAIEKSQLPGSTRADLSSYPQLVEAARRGRGLIMTWNENLPEKWRLGVVLLCGRRSALSKRTAPVTSGFGVPIEITSYDRLVDQDGGAWSP
jgi:hypothetical protein